MPYIDRETPGILLFTSYVARLFGNRINHAFTFVYLSKLAKNIQISVVMNATTKPIKNDLASPNPNVYNKRLSFSRWFVRRLY